MWLLDVDGVLNATKPGWGATPRNGTAYSAGVPLSMRFAPALMQQLREIHRAGGVDIRWATTWVEDIDQITTLMALPSWPCAFTRVTSDTPAAHAKYAAALGVVRGDRRPLIWVDDEHIPSEDSHAIRQIRAEEVPVLLIRPDARRGLQPDELEQITAFIQTCQ